MVAFLITDARFDWLEGFKSMVIPLIKRIDRENNPFQRFSLKILSTSEQEDLSLARDRIFTEEKITFYCSLYPRILSLLP